jgi:dipeptidyl-peptidase-4
MSVLREQASLDTDLLRALAQTRSFHLGVPHHPVITPDGKSVLFLRSGPREPKQSLYEMDLASGSVHEVVTPEALMQGPETLSPEERARRERMRVRTTGLSTFDLSADGTKVLVSFSGHAFVVDRGKGDGRSPAPPPKVLPLLTGAAPVVDPRFSEDGEHVAYVQNNDLHVIAAGGGAPWQVTHGGGERLTHGLAEFVAQEELERSRGYWWAPDGAHILYEEADTSKVDVLTIADPAHADAAPQRIAYPRPGRANADVRFGVVPARGGPTVWIDWDRARFPYVAHASWPKGGPPLLYVLSRLQQDGQLLAVDAATGKTRALVEERDPAWLNVDPSVPRWLPSGKGFLWSTERSGQWQLELRDAVGNVVKELLPESFGYVSVADVDEKRGTAVVVGSEDPTKALPWRVWLDASRPPESLVKDGTSAVSAGASHGLFVSVDATLATMPRTAVRAADGALVREIPSVCEKPSTMPVAEIIEAGSERFRVAVVRPRAFRPGVKVPVIDAAYGGPHHNVVEQSALAFVRAQWMADALGAIVVSIDAQGTPRRGRAWERALYKKLGSVPVEGHVAALEALAEKIPEIDLARVGVYGWSFGGYFAAMAVLTRPDVYKVGVAGAPPADWRDYDTAYTERYLGLPEQDSEAYDAASLLPYAKRLASGAPLRPLLVVHGTADDNVWFLNSLKLADALERGGRPFSFLPLAGTTHMLLDPDLSEVVWTRTVEVLRAGLASPSAP